MSTVKCEVCGKTLGFNIGLGFHDNNNEFFKTKDKKWCCSERCARDYNNSLLNRVNDGNNNPGLNQSNTIEKERLDFEKRKYEDEKREKDERKELDKKKLRDEKSEQLMKEGKKFQSFYVKYIKGLLE